MLLSSLPFRSYSKSELAQMYCPGLSQSAARRNLLNWIERNPELHDKLLESGYDSHQHYFTPMQVALIIRYLGEPD